MCVIVTLYAKTKKRRWVKSKFQFHIPTLSEIVWVYNWITHN